MKKILCLLLALMLCAAVPAAMAEEDHLARIQSAGKLVMASEGCWAPWTYVDENGQLTGLDVEIARYIADYIGVELDAVECEWEGLIAGLNGRYDIVINGVEYTEERAASNYLSNPYVRIRTAVIVRSDNTAINSFEDLAGKTTANTISSTYAMLAEQYGATPSGVDDLNQTIMLVLQGRVDATLNAEVSFYEYMAANPDAPLRIAALTEQGSDVCAIMSKGADNDSLLSAVNEAIGAMLQDGTMTALCMKYFGSDFSAR